jgi:hypothetical protein
LKKFLEVGVKLKSDKEDADFWKLQYKMKWELESYGEQKMEPVQNALINAFTKLGYQHPREEALLLLVNMDGLATRFYLQESFDLEAAVEFMQSKYNL